MTAPATPSTKKPRPLPPWDETDNPWNKPAAYLLARGWKFKGNPHSPNSRWFAPDELDDRGQPRGERETRQKFKVMKTELDPVDPKKTVQVLHKEFDRTVIIPAAAGVSRDEAVQMQLDRDYETA